jgi:hypothetical protein
MEIPAKKVLNKMKRFLPFALLIAGAELMQASIVETISFRSMRCGGSFCVQARQWYWLGDK